MLKNKSKKKLVSLSGRKCLTKCYPTGKHFLHPITLIPIANLKGPGCATYNRLENDEILTHDECNLDDNKLYEVPDELNTVLFDFHLASGDFLSEIYGINSFNDVINWTNNNNYLPFNTIKRVHNCAWKTYVNEDNHPSALVIQYYHEIAKTYWLKDYLIELKQNYSFDISEQNDDTLYELFAKKYFTYDFIFDSVQKYITTNINEWNNIKSHYLSLKKYIFSELITLIDKNNNISDL